MHACLFTQRLWESQAGLQPSNRLLWEMEGNLPNNHVCYANDKTAHSPLNFIKALQLSEMWLVRTIPGVGSGSQLSLVSHQVFPPILLEGFAAWVDSAEEHSWGWLRLHSRSTRSEPASPDPFSHTPNQPLISDLPVHRNNTKWQFRECCSNWCLSWWSSKAQPSSAASVTPALSWTRFIRDSLRLPHLWGN